MKEPVWLPIEAVIETNKDLVADTGEPFFLRDRGLLESALDSPKNSFFYNESGEIDIVDLATKLLLAIARNHAFEQGNKRTAFASALMFLELNGYRVDELADVVLATVIPGTIDRTLGEDALSVLFRLFVTPAEPQD